jgi:hypothetical protein
MTTLLRQLTLASQDEHTATFSYRLQETHGWELRAQLEN